MRCEGQAFVNAASVFLKRTFTRGLFRYVCHIFFKMFLYDFWKWKEIIFEIFHLHKKIPSQIHKWLLNDAMSNGFIQLSSQNLTFKPTLQKSKIDFLTKLSRRKIYYSFIYIQNSLAFRILHEENSEFGFNLVAQLDSGVWTYAKKTQSFKVRINWC